MVDLREERSANSDDRIYITTVVCINDFGNSTTSSVTITLPYDPGQGSNKKK